VELIAHKLAVPPGVAEVILAPLGDIQWAGRKEHIAYSQLQEHIAEALERKAWFIGMGDYVDFASPSNRQRLKAAALYDTAEQVIDDKARALVDELYADLLKPTAGRWLGLLEGHHWTHLLTGDTTDQYLATKLRAPFLGTTAYLGLVFRTTWGARTVTVWAHHGAGGGQKVHAPVLKLENLATSWDADIMLVAHMTKRATGVLQRCYPVWTGQSPVIRHREIHLVGCGGWLKGYAERARQGQVPRGGYVEQKMLTPVALGAPFVRIRPKMRQTSDHTGPTRLREKYWEPEIRVET
jgi:hypothetical protein